MATAGGNGGIDGLHAAVDAQDKIVHVEAQSKAVGHSNLPIEFIKLKFTAGLIGIVALYERCPEAHALLFGLSGIVAFVWITAILAKRRDHVEGDEP